VEFDEVLSQRYSARRYTDREVTDDELRTVLSAGPGSYVCPTGILALGHPADADRPRAAKPELDSLVRRGSWT
jgi:hypothetical protein